MKHNPKTVREWTIDVLVIAVLQPSTRYLRLRVLYWNIFVSAWWRLCWQLALRL
jgi:hypothetical protein